jgi:hypothetical protein
MPPSYCNCTRNQTAGKTQVRNGIGAHGAEIKRPDPGSGFRAVEEEEEDRKKRQEGGRPACLVWTLIIL